MLQRRSHPSVLLVRHQPQASVHGVAGTLQRVSNLDSALAGWLRSVCLPTSQGTCKHSSCALSTESADLPNLAPDSLRGPGVSRVAGRSRWAVGHLTTTASRDAGGLITYAGASAGFAITAMSAMVTLCRESSEVRASGDARDCAAVVTAASRTLAKLAVGDVPVIPGATSDQGVSHQRE